MIFLDLAFGRFVFFLFSPNFIKKQKWVSVSALHIHRMVISLQLVRKRVTTLVILIIFIVFFRLATIYIRTYEYILELESVFIEFIALDYSWLYLNIYPIFHIQLAYSHSFIVNFLFDSIGKLHFHLNEIKKIIIKAEKNQLIQSTYADIYTNSGRHLAFSGFWNKGERQLAITKWKQ